MEDELIKKTWEDTLVLLQESIAPITIDTWIKPLVPHSLEDNCFCVLTGHQLAVQLLQKEQGKISEALTKVCGQEIYFKVVYDEDLHKKIEDEKKKAKKAEDKEYIKNLENRITKTKYDGLKQMQSDCKLNVKYKFDNFVVGSCNKFAYAVAQAVAKNPGNQYNPLFIYGGSGLGKTHLLQAIGHYILFNKSNLKVKYIKAEDFINDLINSLAKGGDKAEKNKRMNDFRNKYRNVDVLLVDDIQIIEGKERTEEEMFNTFDSLHSVGKQIVFTSDRSPDKFENSPDRLKTRFQMGLLADVQVPDLETRMAILTKLAQDNDIRMPFDVIEFIASVHNKNIRELEGTFNTVSAFSKINEMPITIDMVKKLIGYSEKRKTCTIDGIVDIVAGFYNVSVNELKGSGKTASIANARQVAMYLAKELTGESFPHVGKCFNRKHTTIMYAHQKVKADMVTNRHLNQDIKELTEKINS